MNGINMQILLGTVGRDPEVRQANGKSVANFSIAVNETWKDTAGKKQEKTEWFRCVAWGRTAEVAGEYLRKGSTVHVTGRAQTREWTNKEGVKQLATECVVDRLTLIGPKPGDRANSGASDATDNEQPRGGENDIDF